MSRDVRFYLLDILTHECQGVDCAIVRDIVANEAPALHGAVSELLNDGLWR